MQMIITDTPSVTKEDDTMTITKTLNGTDLVVAVEGRLDTVTSPDFEAEMTDALKDVTSVTLDFEKLEYISSAGLRALLLVRTTLYNNATLKIINANELVKEVFDVTGFKKIIPID